jgi:hypothetical protein
MANNQFAAVNEKGIMSAAFMCCLDLQPLNTISRDGFHLMCNILNPQFKPPTRETVTSRVNEIARYARDKLANRLRVDGAVKNGISITTDGWTSIRSRAYQCVTGHYIVPY